MTVMNSKVTLFKRKTSHFDEQDCPLSVCLASSFSCDCPLSFCPRELALGTAGVCQYKHSSLLPSFSDFIRCELPRRVVCDALGRSSWCGTKLRCCEGPLCYGTWRYPG